MRLENKTILITGGSAGIGFETAKQCVTDGATVIIAAREKKNLENALAQLKSISNKEHQWYSLDVSRYQNVQKFAQWCKERIPSINGLVNCAGIYGPIGKFDMVNIDKFVEAIQTNFLGTVYLCHEFIPLLKSSTKKKIVNFSGGGAATPFPNYSAYATSKIAIVRFTENLAIELADDEFDINCVAPGFVLTRLHQQTLDAGPIAATEAFFNSTKKQLASGGVPPAKAAELTAFLLSEQSDGISGKFLSAPYDPWQDLEFQKRLRLEKDIATLRRIDDKIFFKK
jgi:NAD(P)-dependent dehydrogenase (short-subunit alcohol dehydrogenase family)